MLEQVAQRSCGCSTLGSFQFRGFGQPDQMEGVCAHIKGAGDRSLTSLLAQTIL